MTGFPLIWKTWNPWNSHGILCLWKCQGILREFQGIYGIFLSNWKGKTKSWWWVLICQDACTHIMVFKKIFWRLRFTFLPSHYCAPNKCFITVHYIITYYIITLHAWSKCVLNFVENEFFTFGRVVNSKQKYVLIV